MGDAVASPGRIGSLGRPATFRLLVGIILGLCTGCQYTGISVTQLEMHEFQLNKTGLAAPRDDSLLKVTCAPPDLWDQLPTQHNVIYSHEQWRSPDRLVGMGVAYMRTPLAVSAQTIIWFAKTEYVQSGDNGGKLLGQWTDSLGRCWFDAEDNEYHILGYAMTRGCDAWIVYSGYRRAGDPPQEEIALAARGADSVVPMPADR